MPAKYIEKTLRMSSEITKIFDDLDTYRDYCRSNMLKFDERDLYKSDNWKRSMGMPVNRRNYSKQR